MLEEINKRGGKRRGVPCSTPPSHSLFHSHVPIYGSAFPISKTPHVEKTERERAEERKSLKMFLKRFLDNTKKSMKSV